MMYHHHSLCRFLSFIVTLLLSLTAIAIGLLAFNIEVINLPFVQTNLKSFIMPAYIAIGIAGIISLFHFLTGFVCSDKQVYCNKCNACEAPHSHSR